MSFSWLNYEVLRLIWWSFIGVLLIGFAIMDGFDMGVAALLPFVSRNEVERRMAINSIGPTWEGNQVWFVLGGGAVFAAFPMLYATAFSGFYFAMFLILVALILRPVGFDFRAKMPGQRWRNVWDSALFIGGLVPPIVFGVAVGNLFLGVPFNFNPDMRLLYTGGLLDLLNPWGLTVGVMSLVMLLTQGGTFLIMKTDGAVRDRSRRAVYITAGVFIVLLLVTAWIAGNVLDGYRIVSDLDPNAASRPLAKVVEKIPGAWLDNYRAEQALWLFPALSLISAISVIWLTARGREILAFLCSSIMVAATIATAGASLFPFFMPSSLNPNASLTLWDASSSYDTLLIMLLVTLVFLPIVILYTAWIYRVMRGKVTEAYVRENSGQLY